MERSGLYRGDGGVLKAAHEAAAVNVAKGLETRPSRQEMVTRCGGVREVVCALSYAFSVFVFPLVVCAADFMVIFHCCPWATDKST